MSTIVISGANRGIGRELAKQLSDRGDTVVALVRSSSSDLDALGVEVITGVDVTADDLGEVTQKFEGRSIDVLLNNAGLLQRTTLNALNLEAIRRQFEVNTLGPIKLTSALRGSLHAGRVVHITEWQYYRQ